MLSQRFAKYAVLALLGYAQLQQRSASGMAESRAAFETALTDLNGLPLSTLDIHTALEAAGGQPYASQRKPVGRASGPLR